MKKAAFVILSLAFAPAILSPLNARADQFADFTHTSDGTNVTITGYTGSGGSIEIPNKILGLSVISIGDGAFAKRIQLTDITIPASVTNIAPSAFSRCSRLTAINVSVANATYSSLNGVLFNKNQTLLIQYPGPFGKTSEYTIPESVTSIGNGAFFGCGYLTSVKIPDSVTNIDDWAFASCASLTSVTLPDSVTTIGFFTFAGCQSLVSVTIPASVQSIGTRAFDGCTSLTSVYFSGLPPKEEIGVFSRTPATLYYLPAHADHWPKTYVGRPTAVWQQQAP
jgi:hypothetical protein